MKSSQTANVNRNLMLAPGIYIIITALAYACHASFNAAVAHDAQAEASKLGAMVDQLESDSMHTGYTNELDSCGYSLLHRVAMVGRVDLAARIVPIIRNPNAESFFGLTPRDVAALAGQSDDSAIQRYLQSVGGVHKAFGSNSDPLANASFSTVPTEEHLSEQELDKYRERLRTGKVDINSLDNSGLTALHKVARRGRVDLARQLVSLGADPNVYSGFGFTPLTYALQGNQTPGSKIIVYLESIGGR